MLPFLFVCIFSFFNFSIYFIEVQLVYNVNFYCTAKVTQLYI